MGIVAPVTGVLAAVIPVVAGIVAGRQARRRSCMVGIVVAVVAVVLVSRVADEGGGRAGLGAGAGQWDRDRPLRRDHRPDQRGRRLRGRWRSIRLVRRSWSSVVIVATRGAWRPPRRLVPAIPVIGILDMAGNGFYMLAVQTGPLAIASVLSSLYPVATVVLAAVVLRERVTREHAVGIVLAGIAIALIGAFGA